MRHSKPVVVLLILSFLFWNDISIAQSDSEEKPNRETQQQIQRIVTETFQQMHDGWSSDEVILQDELNESFVSKCESAAAESEELADAAQVDWNWTLMNLRKAGKLKSKTVKRNTIDLSNVSHIAEIVARSLIDQHQCSIDRLICDAQFRSDFNAAAKEIDSSIDTYAVRKAAFQLRKARKLKPELISRIADWGRTIESYSISEILEQPTVLNEHPGIYIFRDSSGYLYIGQTENLRDRLQKHLDQSHNLSLAKYLDSESRESISIEVHDFDPESKASKTRVRRAYESELIASRKPRFNLQP